MESISRAALAQIIDRAGIDEAYTTVYRPWGNDETGNAAIHFANDRDIRRFCVAAGAVMGEEEGCDLIDRMRVDTMGRELIAYFEGVRAEEPEQGPGSVEMVTNQDGEMMFQAISGPQYQVDFYRETEAWAHAYEG